MTRLTARNKDGTAYFPECFKEPCSGFGCQKEEACKFMEDVCEKLAEFEDMQESGRLIELPCKVGDTLYIPYINTILERSVDVINVYRCVIRIHLMNTSIFVQPEDFGKTVFSAREDAEEALKNMKEGE